ncbi:MAG: M28 family peptidase [Bacteroidales bacterium]|nr:M28 family peptidase [Bacteroidales bacterium]
MKKYALLLGLFISVTGFGQQLILQSYTNTHEIETLYATGLVSIHHTGADFIIATASHEIPAGALTLKHDPWSSEARYFLVWFPEDNTREALNQLTGQYNLLYSDAGKAIVEVPFISQSGPKSLVHGGVVKISPASSWKPEAVENSRYVIDTFPIINDMIALVDTGEFMPTMRHLEGYGTRYCQSPQAFEAQDWIKAKFEEYPELEVELQDFPYWGGSSSDNVIATLPGTVNPDEYIVVGAHYDSFAWGPTAPGADDNASGTAAVLELARILSQYEFDKSIVFCAFSAEEEGLIGSEYYASRAQTQGMDILGYFNFDMIGYRHQSDPIHTDMIAPPSAAELVNFYKGVVAIYLPDFEVFDAQLSGGDSDHTSFNNNGYMGIFPFEDVPNYSPYIHTSQDLVGPSVNCPEMASTFIQANLASLVSLSVPYDPVGMEDPKRDFMALRLYPNPATSTVTFRAMVKEPLNIVIYSGLGQQVLERIVHGQLSVDVTTLPSGVYMVQVALPDRTEFHRLIVSSSR